MIQISAVGRGAWQLLLAFILGLVASSGNWARGAAPTVFWAPDQVGPGDTVLLYGGGLTMSETVLVWRLPDGNPGQPPAVPPLIPPASAVRVKALQPTDSSVKFVLPESLTAGGYGFQIVAGTERSPLRVLNRPELWFLQPTALLPGLAANQAPPGGEVQLVGKNLTVRGDQAPRPRLALRLKGGGPAIVLSMVKAEPFSVTARLPEGLAPGQYELFAHPGRGGAAAWSEPLAVEVKRAQTWPDKVFNVRDFGAKGDDVTDDTKAIRDALAASKKNSGGVVYFPWGTYRLSDWLLIPERTVLRGEVRDATILKWPLDAPKDEKDFAKAAIYLGAQCGLEDLTLTARRVEHILLDVQFELHSPKTMPPEVVSRVRPWGQGGDIFLRRLLVHHLLLAARPEQQKPVMENPALNKRYWEGLRNVLLHDGRNCEVSDCVFEGGRPAVYQYGQRPHHAEQLRQSHGLLVDRVGGWGRGRSLRGERHSRFVQLGLGVDGDAARLLGAQHDPQFCARRARGDDARQQFLAERPARQPVLGYAARSGGWSGQAFPPLPSSGTDQLGWLQDRVDAGVFQGGDRFHSRVRRRRGWGSIPADRGQHRRHGVLGQAIRHRAGDDGPQALLGDRSPPLSRPLRHHGLGGNALEERSGPVSPRKTLTGYHKNS